MQENIQWSYLPSCSTRQRHDWTTEWMVRFYTVSQFYDEMTKVRLNLSPYGSDISISKTNSNEMKVQGNTFYFKGLIGVKVQHIKYR